MIRICLVFYMTTGIVMAQVGAGSIQGTVRDSSGAVIPGATAVAFRVETGANFSTVSNNAGFFIFPSAQPGKYKVMVDSPGLEKWVGELTLETGQEAVVMPVLQVGGIATQVTVAGDVTPIVNTTSPTLASVADRKRIEELPLNGRFIQNLLETTVPGLEAGAGGTAAPQAFGLRDQSVQFMQDGVKMMDADVGTITTRPPGIDSIQEYRVEMSVASAKFSAAVTTNVVTRSGTNEWHGSVFDTGRNNGFGVARQRQDFYTKAPQYILNEYGASLGGPVRIPHIYNGKDRTFFFAAWEPYSLRNAGSLNTSLPTAAMEQGNFSGLTNNLGQSLTLYDPWSTADKAQNYARTPYPGNIIPISKRSPLAAYVYGVLPQPNLPNTNPAQASNYFGPDPSRENDWTFTTRLDHKISDQDRIYGRYTVGNVIVANRYLNGNTTPVTSDNYWNYQDHTERMQTTSFSWNHIFGPSLFVETVVTGARMNWRFDLASQSATENLAPKLGIPNPYSVGGAPILTAMGFNLTGIGTIPRYEISMPVTAEQNYMKVWGTHQFEFGWRFERTFLDVLPDRPGEGTISFASLATGLYAPASGALDTAVARSGDNLANFFLGVAGSYSQTLPAPLYNLRSNQVSGYFQDNWKIARNLTLNLGVRYDYLQPLLDTEGVSATFDFKSGAIVRNASIAQLIQSGATTQAIVNQYQAIGVKFETTRQAGLDNVINAGQRNLSPRLGMAYNLHLGKRSVVVRGGFGMYHYNIGARLANASQRSDPPLQGTVSYSTISAAQSPNGLPNYGLISAPTIVAGTTSAVNAIDPNAANAIPPGVGVNVFASSLPTPMAREYNVTLETEILRNTLLRVAWVGTQGRNLDESVVKNGQPTNYVYYMETGLPLPTGPLSGVALRDYNQTTYGNISVYSDIGYSNNNSLQVEVQRRFHQGLGFQWYYVLSNAMWTGSGSQVLGNSGQLPDPVTFLPGAVPSNFDAYNRFYNYARDANIPHHRVNWNTLYDLPLGRGKKWFANSGKLLNRIVGGWQLAATSTINSRYVTLPAANWGATSPTEIYGTADPVQDCRSGNCIRGYLWYNGYIPANQINTHNAAGQCIGVCGVPASYHPSSQPIWPIPANPNPSDPNYAVYGTNLVAVPLKSGGTIQVAYNNGMNPLRNQYIPGPWVWTVNSSVFKLIPVTERLKLRLNMDFFNVLNRPGMPMPAAATGIISLASSNNAPRQLQWTARLTW